jgi:membrane-bound serine protease (ClpP class)
MPCRVVLRVVGWRLALLATLTATLLLPSRPLAADGPALVYSAEVDSIIHPVSAEFMVSAIDRADQDRASLLVFTLRTPGGLVESTQTIVARMLSARTPIAVFVAPGGARAASAGFLIVLAADIAAMAPGTHMGAAHPVTVGGDAAAKPDETMTKKVASDLAAWARSLAERRKRNVTLAAEAVTDSRAFTDNEALAAKPPLIDLVAGDVRDLLAKIDGREIPRFDGRTVTISSAGARVVDLAMTRRQQFLSAIAHPQIAYLLMTLGILGLTVELWNPGAIAPGVVGGVCLLLAFFAFQVLPVSTAGLLLILFGLFLLVLEIKLPSFGILGIGGVLSLVVGSLMLPGDVPGVTLHPGVVIPIALAMSAILVFLGRLAVRSQRLPAATGARAMIGRRGRALAPLTPDRPAQIAIAGEIWTATAPTEIGQGEPVEVVAVDGLTLRVVPAGGSAQGAPS